MPSRIIREGWLESERINALDPAAERFFLRLCLRADDFGRYHANPTLLRSNLFPLKEDVRSTDIPRWLAACEKAGLLRCYSADAKPYLVIRKFDQRTRAEKSKFPEPPPDDGLLPGICLTEVSHPRTYSESEADTKSESKAGYPSAPPPAPAGELALGSLLEAQPTGPTVVSAEVIYAAYPRKVAKQDAIKAIEKTMKRIAPLRLLERTQAFAKATEAWTDHDRQYIPHPATWFNRGSYDDDPATWSRATFSGKQLPPMR